MMHKRRSDLSTYMTGLLSEGRVVFEREEARAALGIERRSFLDAAERQQKQGHLLSPRRGFYVIVPPHYYGWGAPPPSWYIDALMRHEERGYYVGLLKAAELHGATHQAVMEFQVVTDKRIPRIKAGRSVIAFYYRKELSLLSGAIEKHQTESGMMNISSLELTAFDLVRYPHAAGGLDNIATILGDLGRRLSVSKLVSLSSAFERSVLQRLGFLLERFGHHERLGPLQKALSRRGAAPWIELEPRQAADPDFAPEPLERSERWKVIIRRMPEPDE